jgi:membrane fusion protein, copper/silver efflux system
MLTSLPRHRGANGPIIAFFILVSTTVVVLLTQPKPAPVEQHPPVVAPVVAPAEQLPSSPLPAASLPAPTPTAAVTPNTIGGTGIVGYDESKTSHLAAPVAGWLQKTRAKSLGQSVRAGETLAVVYSLDVYLTSVEVLSRMKAGPSDTLDAARTRLLRWGMPPWTLTKMQKSGVPERSVPLIARVSGKVVGEQGMAGQLVDPSEGVEYFTISDPTKYWMYIDVPAADAARVKVGAPTKIVIEGVAKPVSGQVDYVYRRVEGGMRSLRIAIQSRMPLRVGTTATAEIKL